jgi:hypothetical protein
MPPVVASRNCRKCFAFPLNVIYPCPTAGKHHLSGRLPKGAPLARCWRGFALLPLVTYPCSTAGKGSLAALGVKPLRRRRRRGLLPSCQSWDILPCPHGRFFQEAVRTRLPSPQVTAGPAPGNRLFEFLPFVGARPWEREPLLLFPTPKTRSTQDWARRAKHSALTSRGRVRPADVGPAGGPRSRARRRRTR